MVVTKLKLFKLIDAEGEPVYFDNKRLAKRKRDELREEMEGDIIIMRGPDHRKGESFNDG